MGEAALKLDWFEAVPAERRSVTLLDLVRVIAESGASEQEVVATVTHLVNTGQVQLVGNFRGSDVRIT